MRAFIIILIFPFLPSCGSLGPKTVLSNSTQEDQINLHLYVNANEGSSALELGAQAWTRQDETVKFIEPSYLEVNNRMMKVVNSTFDLRGTAYGLTDHVQTQSPVFTWRKHDRSSESFRVDKSPEASIRSVENCTTLLSGNELKVRFNAHNMKGTDIVEIEINDGSEYYVKRTSVKKSIYFSKK